VTTSLAETLEDAIEAAYWEFDARHRGTGKRAGMSMSERDAFKTAVRALVTQAQRDALHGIREEVDRAIANGKGLRAQLDAATVDVERKMTLFLEALQAEGVSDATLELAMKRATRSAS
jgi:hypothetical protein